jgi:hypothetical protein
MSVESWPRHVPVNSVGLIKLLIDNHDAWKWKQLLQLWTNTVGVSAV